MIFNYLYYIFFKREGNREGKREGKRRGKKGTEKGRGISCIVTRGERVRVRPRYKIVAVGSC